MDKRGISTLIATILIVLIAVVAVGIIWAAIMPMITNASRLSQACSQVASIVINAQAGYTCYDQSTNEILIMISRGSTEIELAGAQISILFQGTSKSFEIEAGKEYPNIRMITQTEYGLPLETPGKNEDKTYVIDSTDMSTIEEVKLAPIIKVGISKKKCSVSSSITIPKCVQSPLYFDLNVTAEI
ncbi:hypothetical protein HZA33_05000 [Candidatus Pacearchaeota archaeon]|nr:hypothetical protein [Candidatus Pacearchaeota archaeon]